MITLQQIFNAAWQAFIVEGQAPGVVNIGYDDDYYECRYRTPDGRACAVGLCLPAGHPAAGKEDVNFGSIVDYWPELFDEQIQGMGHDGLDSFQHGLHDSMVDTDTGEWDCSVEEREKKYRRIAKQFGLEVPR